MFGRQAKLKALILTAGLVGASVLLVMGWMSSAATALQGRGVEVGPDHSRQANAGQTIIYHHTLTNTGTTTDSFWLEVSSTQGWPVELLGGDYPTGTLGKLVLPQVAAQMTAPFQVSLTVPLSAVGVTEITLITATSQLSPTVQGMASDTTIVPYRTYLPLVFRRWPPIPYQPALNPISNADGDGNYIVSWAEPPSRLAETYTLQESTDAAFATGLRDVCTTAQQSCDVNGRLAGTYYYRVQGHNGWGDSVWSSVQSATVLRPDTPTLNTITNTDGDGSYTVSWSTAARASSYTLQQDTDPAFGSPTTVFDGVQTFWSTKGKTGGTYYYRVRATGPTGQSSWSATQSVSVLLPDVPYLNPISNTDGDGNYSVTWNAAARATSYVLQEDTSSAFTTPANVHTGSGTSWSATGKTAGTYYYRVQAVGPTGTGAWSNVQAATVIPPTPIPSPEITCWVSDSSPARYTTVTVYGKLARGALGISGVPMRTEWHYKTTTSYCSGTSGSSGVASCSRYIAGATAGYRVNIKVTMTYDNHTYSCTTSFTPH